MLLDDYRHLLAGFWMSVGMKTAGMNPRGSLFVEWLPCSGSWIAPAGRWPAAVRNRLRTA